MAVGADRWFLSQQYAAAGLEVIENTPEEILGLTRELNETLDGTWKPPEEDEELQQRYRALIPPGHRCYGFPSRAGAEFLLARGAGTGRPGTPAPPTDLGVDRPSGV